MSDNSSKTNSVIGKLLAGAFLSDFRQDGKSGPQLIQFAVGKLRKYLGEDNAKTFFNASYDMHRALLCACIDYSISDCLSDETVELMKNLQSPGERVLVEMIYLKATGQDFTQKSESRWAPALWRFHNVFDKYLEMSPTHVSDAEMAEAMKEIALPFLAVIREHMTKQF